jgi:hypothetical protein
MIRIDALSIPKIPRGIFDVARMANVNIIRYRSMRNNPSPPVRGVSFVSHLNISVPISSNVSIPNPATVSFGDVRPKLFRGHRLLSRRSRAVLAMPINVSVGFPLNPSFCRVILRGKIRPDSAPALAQSHRNHFALGRRRGLSQYGLPQPAHRRGRSMDFGHHAYPHRLQVAWKIAGPSCPCSRGFMTRIVSTDCQVVK